ncbi:MAG: hypothetical protein QG670_1893 [Thermoproteota archaeon]|nr:hypothetical protein [Thermoproteota archaeon]
MIQRDVDVAVVGGGAAGLAAAIRARREGVEKVLILERGEELGGVLHQCIHTGFGLHYFKENLTGPEYVSRFINIVHELGIEYKVDTMVLKVSSEKRITAINSVDGLMSISAKSIVFAVGCRERTRGSLSIPGTRPAGIFTAGTAQRLMEIEGSMPGRRLMILGSGDVGLIMARRFVMEGAKVEAVLEIMPYPGGLSRNIVQCLDDFNIPLLLGYTVTLIHGKDRLEGVTVAKIDRYRRLMPGTEKFIGCDTLILSVGLIPENELTKDMGVVLDPLIGGPMVNERMETSIEGVFACGNVVHVHDLVDHVTEAGETAGRSAARYVLGALPPFRRRLLVKPGANVRYVVPQIISGKESVSLFFRVKRPARYVTVKAGDEVSEFRQIVRPPELASINLPGGIHGKDGRIVVSVRRRSKS